MEDVLQRDAVIRPCYIAVIELELDFLGLDSRNLFVEAAAAVYMCGRRLGVKGEEGGREVLALGRKGDRYCR